MTQLDNTENRHAALLDDALTIVTREFHGITDKAGQPYLLHCLRVMHGVASLQAKQVAVMHDLIEDTAVTIDQLRASGFSEEVLTALQLVTHAPSDSYADYVVRLKGNEVARQVKLADLRDNYSIDRVAYREPHREQDAARIQRYILSFQFLTDTIDEASYRRQMHSVE